MRGHVTVPWDAGVARHLILRHLHRDRLGALREPQRADGLIDVLLLGAEVVTIAERELPPSESWSSRVSFELRHGTWPTSPLASRSITVPSA